MFTWIHRCLLALALSGLAACTQLPTEKASVVDLRPQISFKTANENSQSARVFLDNQEVGFVGDFLDGKSALRVLSGNHVVRVVGSAGALLEERFYIGDGVARVFMVR